MVEGEGVVFIIARKPAEIVVRQIQLVNVMFGSSTSVMNYTIVVVILILVINCTGNAPNSDFHPNLEFYFQEYEGKLAKSDFKNINIFEEFFAFSLIDSGYRSIDFSDYYISDISEVLISNSEIFVLDQRAVKVHKIDLDTSSSSEITRSGRGPGEIVSPSSIQLDGDTLIIADRVNGFSFHHVDGTHIKDVKPGILPDYFCRISDYSFIKSTYVIINGELQHDLIYKLNNDYEVIKSFGMRYKNEHTGLSSQLSFGKILCNQNKEVVVNTYIYGTPIVEIYNVNKDRLLVLYLDGINPLLFELVNEVPVISAEKNSGLVHSYISANILKDRFIVLQYKIYESREEIKGKILSYFYCLETDEFYISYNLPIIKTSFENKVLTQADVDNFVFDYYTFDVTEN